MSEQTAHYYSNGKLLLTGEYLIIYGAKALAVPVKFGQDMKVEYYSPGELRWEAFIQNHSWFSVSISLPQLQLIETNDNDNAILLLSAIRNARIINREFLDGKRGYKVTTQLNYPQEWGLGSSSTFIANLAQWAKVDALQLNATVSNGSGYDVACAKANSPILFQISDNRATWKDIAYNPPFSNNLFFVYLGQKQDSSESVGKFRGSYQFNSVDVDYISTMSERFTSAGSLNEVISIIDLHEAYLSKILAIETIKQRLFSDFQGTVKSLGAWGGDFVMAASPMSYELVKAYFKEKGFETIFTFKEMVLNSFKADLPL
jgi:mevalonate kinase